MTALCLTGCASSRKSVMEQKAQERTESVRTDSLTRHVADSVSEYVEVRTTPVSVPRSEVRLAMASDSLLRLPEGAVYRGRSGQAGVEVGRKAATATEPELIYVYASCDSLELQCERYERTIQKMRSAMSEQGGTIASRTEQADERTRREEKQPAGSGMPLKWYLYGILTGGVLARIKDIISIIKKITRQ